ncbi:MAG: PspA/IM30 family protein [Deltaproteobacteria bacterium]|nr:PspA/IM30 family protein [Deltaproteobacteria bacterium]
MNMIKRIRNVFKANINSMLDKAEDPIKTLDVIADDMRAEISVAKKRVAEAMAQEKLLGKELEEYERSIDSWTSRAEKALKSDREDLAREALKEKGKAMEKITALKPQSEHFKKECERLKEEFKQMEERYEAVLAKKDILIAKAKVAKARSAAAFAPSTSLAGEESQQAFERADAKIRHMSAKSEAGRPGTG